METFLLELLKLLRPESLQFQVATWAAVLYLSTKVAERIGPQYLGAIRGTWNYLVLALRRLDAWMREPPVYKQGIARWRKVVACWLAIAVSRAWAIYFFLYGLYVVALVVGNPSLKTGQAFGGLACAFVLLLCALWKESLAVSERDHLRAI